MRIEGHDRLLIVAPHSDDESIGCGGLLAKFGKQCDVWVVTDGRHGHTTAEYEDEDRLVEIRKQETLNAMRIAGVENVRYIGIEDCTVGSNRKELYKQSITEYTYILVPNRYESHCDHNVLYSVFKRMKRKQKALATIIEYEVWTPMTFPTDFLDITDVIDKKREMLQQYRSQIADVDYVSKGIALSQYRGMVGQGQYCEAFADSRINTSKRRLLLCLPVGLRSFLLELKKR